MKRNVMPATEIEYMIIAASREIENGQVLMIGTQWPVPVAFFAKRSHAPDSVFAFEGGIVYEGFPPRTPVMAIDPCFMSGSSFCGGTLDTLGAILHGGLVDLAILAAANVDRFGNINTTYLRVGEKQHRLGGSGGACDFSCLASKLVIIMEHDKKRLPERVNYVTSPGYLDGYGTRAAAGLAPGTGPWALYTTMGLFKFERGTGEMYLDGFYRGVTVEQIKENTGWDLKISPSVSEILPPTEEELDILRTEVDPEGLYLKNNRAKWSGKLY